MFTSALWTTLSRRGLEARMGMQEAPGTAAGASPASGNLEPAEHSGDESVRGLAIGARLTMAAFGLAALLWTLPSLTAILPIEAPADCNRGPAACS